MRSIFVCSLFFCLLLSAAPLPTPYGTVLREGLRYNVRYYDKRGVPSHLWVPFDRGAVRDEHSGSMRVVAIEGLDRNSTYEEFRAAVRRAAERGIAIWPIAVWYGDDPYLLTGTLGLAFKETVPGRAQDRLLHRLGLRIVDRMPSLPFYRLVAVRPGDDPFVVAEQLRQSGLVDWAQPDWEQKISVFDEPTPVAPDDTYFTSQWHHAKIRSDLAWAILPAEHQSPSIAVVDCGVDLTHPDLIDNMKADLGFDFVDDDAIASPAVLAPTAQYPYKKLAAHGTCVAGVAAARGNNGKGVAGVCWDCGIVPIRLIDNTGNGTVQQPPKDTSSRILEALIWAVDSGAAVINNSWGPANAECKEVPFNNFLEYATMYAVKKGRDGLGAVMVWAAGNDYCDTAKYPYFADPHIVVVSALRYNTLDNGKGYKATYSNYGSRLTIAAPAGDPLDGAKYNGLMTTDISGAAGYESTDYLGVENFTGTSAAAPVVSGAIALMLAARPNMPLDDVLYCLRKAAISTRDARIAAGDLVDHSIIDKDHQVIGQCEWSDREDPYVAGPTPHSSCYGYGYLDVYEMLRAALAGECDGWQRDLCAKDEDCPEGLRCDVASGRCFIIYGCTSDSQCLSGNCDEESGACLGPIAGSDDDAVTADDAWIVDADEGVFPDEMVPDDHSEIDGEADDVDEGVVGSDTTLPNDETADGLIAHDEAPVTGDDDLILEDEPLGCACAMVW